MNHFGKRTLCMLIAIIMVLSILPAPSFHAHAVDTVTQIPTENVIASYTADTITRPYGDPIVDDTDSTLGRAVKYSYADRVAAHPDDAGLRNAMIRTGEQVLEVRTNNGIVLGGITVPELQTAAQAGTYKIYKFSNILLTDANFIYMFDCWGFQLPLNDYKTQLADLPVDVYLSMKITGDPTNASVNPPAYYIDQAVVVEHTGGEEESDELTITFTPANFNFPYASLNNGDKVVEDADSPLGSAVVASYADRAAINDNGMMNAVIFGDGKNMKIYTRTDESILVGEIDIETLRANQGNGYFTYVFSDVILAQEDDTSAFFYFFEDWSIQLSLNSYLEQLKGQEVDVALSMKIVGNVSNQDVDAPTYYIDKVIVTTGTYEEEHVHSYGQWTYADEENHSATCECSDVKTEPHDWDEGVITLEPSDGVPGEKTYTCSVCNGTKVEPYEEEAWTLTFLPENFNFPYASMNNGDKVVTDTDSPLGSAVVASYADRAAINDNGMMNAVIFGDGKNMKIYSRTDESILVGEIDIETLRANQGNGYFTYVFSDVILAQEDDTSAFFYFFEDWSIQLSLNNHLDQIKGQEVDVALSMKIVGNVSNQDVDAPTYYIDKVIVTNGTYEEEHVHSYGQWTYVDENNHSATCECSDVKTEPHDWDEGVITLEPSDGAPGEKTYTCSVCNGTKVEPYEEGVWTLTFLPEDFNFPYASLNNGDKVVEDADSPLGSAVVASYADRAAINDNGMMNALIFGTGKTMKIYSRTDASILVGEIDIETLRANQGNGYCTYVFSDVILAEEDDTSMFFYFFEDWSIQLSLNNYLDQIKGQAVNVVLSMKIVGNVSNQDVNAPTYYIDKVIVTTETYEQEHTHTYGEWTYTDDEVHTAACECGYTKSEPHDWDEGVITLEPSDGAPGEKTYTCSVCNGTKVEPYEKEIITITFLASDFSRPYSDPIVDDVDSAHGSAAMYSYDHRAETYPDDAGLRNAMIRPQFLRLYLNNALVDPETNETECLGQITTAELQAASQTGGYTLFAIENVTLSNLDGEYANMFYMFDCWGFQIPLASCKDQLEGETVNIYISMKVTGDVTDAVTNTPAYYIDKVIITTGTYEEEHVHSYGQWTYVDENNHSATCECSDVKTEPHDWDEGVITLEPSDGAPGEKTYTCSVCNGTKVEPYEEQGDVTLVYLANDFSRPYGDPLVIDSMSSNGVAAMYSYDHRAETYPDDAGLRNAMIRPQFLRMYLNNAKTDPATGEAAYLGQITTAELQAASQEGGYKVYAFENVLLNNSEGTFAKMMYLFDCWGFQIPLSQHEALLSGVPVNIYVSMRITGNPTDRANDTPTYYIDKVVISTGEYVQEDAGHSFGDWVYVDEQTHSSSCTHCDDVITGDHIWDEGVITLEPTVDEEGEKTFTCTLCGGTRVESVNKVNKDGISLIFYPEDFHLAYGDPIVSDSAAANGTAVKFDYDTRFATGDKNLYNALIRVGQQTLDMFTNTGVCMGQLPVAKLESNAKKGKYLTYKFTCDNLNNVGFIYMFDCWGLQVKLHEYQELLKDQKVYVYLSMKITGDPTDRTDDTPTYYIDKIEISSQNRAVSGDQRDPINILVTADKFSLAYSSDKVVSDSESRYGVAAVFSYEKRLATGDKGLFNAMMRYPGQTLELYSYGGDPKQGNLLGSISTERLQFHANKGYTVYTFKNVKVTTNPGSYILYLFDCWGLKVDLSASEIEQLEGRRADVYLSMKIVGNPSDTNNPPTYYVDYIKLLPSSGSGCVHDYNDWTLVDETGHSRKCLACGNEQTEEHTWDEGVEVEELPEGEKRFTCTGCGAISEGVTPGQIKEEIKPCEVHTCQTYTNVDAEQHSGICTVCGQEVLESHTWDQGTVIKEATQEQEGEMSFTCTACGATKAEPIAKLSDGQTTQDPVDDAPVIDSDMITWIIMIGVVDLIAIIFLVVLIKKRKK